MFWFYTSDASRQTRIQNIPAVCPVQMGFCQWAPCRLHLAQTCGKNPVSCRWEANDTGANNTQVCPWYPLIHVVSACLILSFLFLAWTVCRNWYFGYIWFFQQVANVEAFSPLCRCLRATWSVSLLTFSPSCQRQCKKKGSDPSMVASFNVTCDVVAGCCTLLHYHIYRSDSCERTSGNNTIMHMQRLSTTISHCRHVFSTLLLIFQFLAWFSACQGPAKLWNTGWKVLRKGWQVGARSQAFRMWLMLLSLLLSYYWILLAYLLILCKPGKSRKHRLYYKI